MMKKKRVTPTHKGKLRAFAAKMGAYFQLRARAASAAGSRPTNKANNTVEANLKSFASAANNAKWSANNGFYQLLTNQPGKDSWPIVATTFVLIPKANANDPQKVAVNKASKKFFSWAFKNGDSMAKELNYIVVPASAQKKIQASW